MKIYIYIFLTLGSTLVLAQESEELTLKKEIEEAIAAANSYIPEEKRFNSADYEKLTDTKDYDIIIVGGGTSGSVLAARLSERPDLQVLLIEAGGEETSVSKIPSMRNIIANSKMNWMFPVESSRNSCQGFKDNACQIRAGKALGGTSSINALWYKFGHPADYDKWGEKNPGWKFEEILPFYKKIEATNLQSEVELNSCFEKDGPLSIENPHFSRFNDEAFIEAFEDMGFPKRPLDCMTVNSAGYFRWTTKNGVRMSSNSAYLQPNKDRSNLHIRKNGIVTKIIINQELKAEGVEFIVGDKLFEAKAKKEVVISAGTIKTPHVLMLSGIGPKSVLENVGIEVKADIPVGASVKTLLDFPALYFTFHDDTPKPTLEESIKDYLENGKGPLTSTQEGHPLVVNVNPEDFKDQTVSPKYFLYGSQILSSRRLKPDISDQFIEPLKDLNILSVSVGLPHPKSTGSIGLVSGDPLAKPLLDLNILSEEEDVDTLLEAVPAMETLIKQPSLAYLNLTWYDRKLPQCKDEPDDNYWRCVVRHIAIPTNNIVGGARMGPENDELSVVDSELRVYKINNLRVADSSIIPVTISGDLTAASYMIGEKAADIIKQAHPEM